MKQELLQLNSGKRLVTSLSISKTESSLKEILAQLQFTKGTIVVWQVNKIRWGKWENDKFTFADSEPDNIKLWLECRIFNEQAELHLTSDKLQLIGQMIEDGKGEPIEYVDASSRFWGECQAKDADWMTLVDKERKLSLKMPTVTEPARFYALVTRNYIEVNAKTGQAGYTDYRYVTVCAADRKGDTGDVQ